MPRSLNFVANPSYLSRPRRRVSVSLNEQSRSVHFFTHKYFHHVFIIDTYNKTFLLTNNTIRDDQLFGQK